MKHIMIIGIGAGNPDYMTVQAIKALNQVDVFFLMDKGLVKAKLLALRREILDRFIEHDRYRIVEAGSPERDREGPEYLAAIEALNRDKQGVFERFIDESMVDGEVGAFLVWGDPSLYDSTIRIIESIARAGKHAFDYEVIPGISSVQALAARHRVPLNLIGRSVEITNGRGVAQGMPRDVDSVVVMLDSQDSYLRLADTDLDIYWGAYVGTPDEILLSGPLQDVKDDIARVRDAARRKHGWIMDSYLLRRRTPAGTMA